MAVFEGKKSSNDIIINDTMCDDEVVASDLFVMDAASGVKF